MAIDRESIRGTLADVKSRRDMSGMKFIPKDKTTNLRVMEFIGPNGKMNFAFPISHFNLDQTGKKQVLNRAVTFGATCAATKIQSLVDENKMENPFHRSRNSFAIIAMNVDAKPLKLEVWQIPTTVWEAMAEVGMKDEWADIFEAEAGTPFAVSKSGTGLDTEYSCVPNRKPVPIPAALIKALGDPLEAIYAGIKDPGLEAQCAVLGVTIEDLFGNDDLTEVEPITSPKSKSKAGKTAPAAAAASPNKKKVMSKPAAESAFGVGVRVEGQFGKDWFPGVITSVEGDDEFAITFDDGDEQTLGGSMIRVLVEETPEPEAETETIEQEIEMVPGLAGTATWDDGNRYGCKIKKVVNDETLTVTWDDGSPASNVTVDDFTPAEDVGDHPSKGSGAEPDPALPIPARKPGAAAAAAKTVKKK